MKKRVLVFVFILLVSLSFVLAEEPTCFDNDLGINYSSRGVVVDESGFYADFCIDEDRLTEYFCEDGVGKSIVVTCAEGCVDGYCINGTILECVPKTCEGQDYQCGVWDDGCGGEINCGGCEEGKICQNAVCVAGGAGGGGGGGSGCVPASCSWLGFDCGLHNDGCGGRVNCGNCSDGKICQLGRCVIFSFGDDFDETPNIFDGAGSIVDGENGEDSSSFWWWFIVLLIVSLFIAVLIFLFTKWDSLSSNALKGATLTNSAKVPKPPRSPDSLVSNPKSGFFERANKSETNGTEVNKISDDFEIRT